MNPEKFSQDMEEARKLMYRAKSLWGEESQKRICIEEMAELTQALCQLQRGRCGEEEVISEIADVFIATMTCAEVFGSDKVGEAITKKLAKYRGAVERAEAWKEAAEKKDVSAG